jgi:hypothetical protein
VSLIQVVADPERFEGELIRVTGYLILSEAENTLYVSSEDADFNNLHSGVYVDRNVSPRMLKELEGASMRHVLIEGTLQIEERSPVLTKAERVMPIQRLGLDAKRNLPLQLTE